MIKTIEILVTEGILNKYNLLIIPIQNICFLNEKKYSISKEKINNIIKIISLWSKEYGTKSGIDLQEFQITITTSQEIDKIHGKGIYPNNYKQLLDIIGDINGQNIKNFKC